MKFDEAALKQAVHHAYEALHAHQSEPQMSHPQPPKKTLRQAIQEKFHYCCHIISGLWQRFDNRYPGVWAKVVLVGKTFVIGFIVAVIIPIYGIYLQYQSFTTEGAVYRVALVGGPDFMADSKTMIGQSSFVFSITNTGRTEGTIVAVNRDRENDTMVVCIPDVAEDGTISIKDEYRDNHMLGNRQFSLQPGQTQLIFMATPYEPLEVVTYKNNMQALAFSTISTPYMNLYRSDGKVDHVHIEGADPVVISHYREFEGYSTVEQQCKSYANQSHKENKSR